ncbi:MAG TPA: glycoside hydrolase family 3 N-terminal domain-containing protein [Capillimicrobium sp.]|nr:glycoside hydrolase family 3 N-terminal domain-containing protein [Capillimicrobium sp.]
MSAAALLAAVVAALPFGGDQAGDPDPLPLRQALGQRMVYAYDGLRPPPALRTAIRRGEAAGVILFARNVRSVAQVRRTVAGLQRIPRPAAVDEPLLVMVDQEGGPVRRLPGAPEQSAAATPAAAAARANGRAAGRSLRGAGINVDLAPVVDVGRRGAALEREGRLYGRDPARVSELGAAFATGLGDAGVAATYKHFPGFGAATVNTDDAPARVELPLATLRRVDLRPYEDPPGDVRLVMLSTAVYPALDPRPAAFSRRWVVGELRGRLGFDGVTITDDLQSPAVARFGTPAQLAYYAASAGVDLPLFAKDLATGRRAYAGLLEAARQGKLDRDAIEASARRVLALRASLAS